MLGVVAPPAPRFMRERTKVARAKPARPRGAGLARGLEGIL